jgi:hypothetical protein
LLRTAAVLEAAQVPYAVAGGNAVALWVSRVDEAAVRNTQDVGILLRRDDLDRAKSALEEAGFVHSHTRGLDIFLDGPEASARNAVHVVFANERIKPGEAADSPDVSESEPAGQFKVLSLAALVRVKLTGFRDKDRVHLRDLLEVGLIDASWLPQLPPPLRERLQELLDNPQ